MTAKSVLMRLQGLRPGALAPTCYATVFKAISTGFRIHSVMYLIFVLITKESSFTILSR